MATISPSWTENVTLRSSATLAAGASDTNDIDFDNLTADAAKVLVDLTIGSSSGITVEVFDSVDSGTTDGDVATLSFTMTATGKRSFSIQNTPYVAVKVTNDDGSNATGNLAITYAWRNWNSA